jgi:hypothetical protein
MTEQRSDTTAIDEAAQADHEAVTGGAGRDGGPQDSSDMKAAEGLTADGKVSEEYAEALERGKNQQGEGRVP